MALCHFGSRHEALFAFPLLVARHPRGRRRGALGADARRRGRRGARLLAVQGPARDVQGGGDDAAERRDAQARRRRAGHLQDIMEICEP